MGIEDDFIAFCFNEACAYLEIQLKDKDGPRPRWKDAKAQAPKMNNSDVINAIRNNK